MHLTAVGPGVWLYDHILTRTSAVGAITRHATRYAERLLTEITASAARALKQAREVRERGEAAIADELQRLAQHRATLRGLSGARDADGDDAS